ncbi:MAG: enoyl-CoA hydratase/isomerase family protein [Dehalococcoidia bacterium]
MTYETILYSKSEGVATITLNRPEVLNALSTTLFRELDTAITEVESDEEVKAVILTGAGDRAFTAGADIHEMTRNAESDSPPPADPKRPTYAWHIGSCTKPTIGALNGLAYGGGAVLASSLDIRIGCEKTKFRFLAAAYGRVNSTWSLPMQVGWPKAKELLLTARVVEADESLQIGLLNHLVDSSELLNKANELASLIVGNDARMVQGIKKLLIDDIGESWESTYQKELNAQDNDLEPTPVLEGFKPFIDRKGRKA